MPPNAEWTKAEILKYTFERKICTIRPIFANVVASPNDTSARFDREKKSFFKRFFQFVASVNTRAGSLKCSRRETESGETGSANGSLKKLGNDGWRRVERDWKSSFIWKLIRGSGGESTIRSQQAAGRNIPQLSNGLRNFMNNRCPNFHFTRTLKSGIAGDLPEI